MVRMDMDMDSAVKRTAWFTRSVHSAQSTLCVRKCDRTSGSARRNWLFSAARPAACWWRPPPRFRMHDRATDVNKGTSLFRELIRGDSRISIFGSLRWIAKIKPAQLSPLRRVWCDSALGQYRDEYISQSSVIPPDLLLRLELASQNLRDTNECGIRVHWSWGTLKVPQEFYFNRLTK